MIENWLFIRLIVFQKIFSKSEIQDFWRKLMPTFFCKPQLASFYSSLIQPYTKLCHRQKDFSILFNAIHDENCLGTFQCLWFASLSHFFIVIAVLPNKIFICFLNSFFFTYKYILKNYTEKQHIISLLFSHVCFSCIFQEF